MKLKEVINLEDISDKWRKIILKKKKTTCNTYRLNYYK